MSPSAGLAPRPTADRSPVLLHHHPADPADGPRRGRLTLLHGLGNSASVWQEFLPHRPAGYESWSVDLPWRADAADSWHHEPDPSRWTAEALASVPGGAGVVVAHSYATIQLLTLLDRLATEGVDPVRRYGITGLVLVSPFYRRSPQDFDWGAMTRYLNDFERIMADGIRVHARGRLDASIRDAMARRVCERVGPYGWLRFVDGYLRTPWLNPGLIDVPAAIVCGGRDVAVPPEEGLALATDLPHARAWVLPECGHFLMSEHPETFAAAVGEFVETLHLAAEPNRAVEETRA